MGSNISTTPTKDIQKNLKITVDDQYGPQTTQAVKDFQSANGLKVDGIFGPKTQAVYNNKFNNGSSIISTDPIHREATDNSNSLDEALRAYNTNYINPDNQDGVTNNPLPTKPKEDKTLGTSDDPFIKELDALSARSNDSTKMLIQNIKANKTRQEMNINTQFEKYKSGLQLLGIQTGKANFAPDLLTGQIQEATNQKQQEINDLNAKESSALMDAENARADQDFKVLNEKMAYVKQIKQEKAQALKDYNDLLTNRNDAITKQGEASAKLLAPDIYKTLQTLDDADKEKFLTTIAKKFNIPLVSLVTALSIEHTNQTKDDEKILSPSEAAVLGVPYGTTEKEAAKKGIIPERYKPASTEVSDSQKLKDAEKEITNALKTGKDANGNVIGNPKGADGYVDYGIYLKAMEKWPGTDKDFLATFPVVGTINPLSYNKLPESIRPKTREL